MVERQHGATDHAVRYNTGRDDVDDFVAVNTIAAVIKHTSSLISDERAIQIALALVRHGVRPNRESEREIREKIAHQVNVYANKLRDGADTPQSALIIYYAARNIADTIADVPIINVDTIVNDLIIDGWHNDVTLSRNDLRQIVKQVLKSIHMNENTQVETTKDSKAIDIDWAAAVLAYNTLINNEDDIDRKLLNAMWDAMSEFRRCEYRTIVSRVLVATKNKKMNNDES